MDVLFLGAAGTVTGSKSLVSAGGRRILVDAGLFQGFKHLRLRNRHPLPVDVASIDAVVLTHAHVDHCGYVPLLIKNGFRGKVFCTPATADLCAIMLPDSGKLQEEEAGYANQRGHSKHRPALPLYTEEDARDSLARFEPLPHERDLPIGPATVRLHAAGHILGASLVRVTADGTDIVFTGDLGRPGDPILVDPAVVKKADHLVVESTYGNREHEQGDVAEHLHAVIARTIARGGTVVIPSFAVGRAQQVLYYLGRLRAAGKLKDVPVHVNSPMARDVTELYVRHRSEHRLSQEACAEAFGAAHYVRTVDESKALNASKTPKVIISASGMATGGRVLHHLRAFAPDPASTILFVGFQAGGTRGRDMVEGASSVRIHGVDVPIRAEVVALNCLSAHADWKDTMKWLSHFDRPPRRTFLTHGEPDAAEALRKRIAERGWRVDVPQHGEHVTFE